MSNALTTIRKNGAYTLLTPDESGLLVGHLEGKPVAYFFSQKRKASAFRAAIGKNTFPIVKEDARTLTEELVDLGVTAAFIDPDNPQTPPDPLNLAKYLEHLQRPAS